MDEMETEEGRRTRMAKEGFRRQSPGAFVDTGEDPAKILHDMKVEAQEREQIRRMRMDRGEDPLKEPMKLTAGTYDGDGGYKYEVMPDGNIKIVEAPGGRGVGVTLKSGNPAHEAISLELEAKSPVDDARQEEADILTSMQGSRLRREEEARQATGVRAGEGRSGQELARMQSLDHEGQMAEMERMNRERAGKSGGPSKVKMSDAAQAAFARTKARTAKES